MSRPLSKKSLSLFGLAFGMLSFFISCSCQQEPTPAPTTTTTQKVEQKVEAKPKAKVKTKAKAKPKTKADKNTCPVGKKHSSKDFVESVKNRKWFSFWNQKPSDPYAYYYDETATYGPSASLTNLSLVRWRAHCEADIKEGTKIVNGKVETFLEVVSPSVNAYKFEGVSKVIVEVDGKQHVFDSDEIDLQKSLANNPAKQVVVEGVSDNPRSINSAFFKETLKKARKVSFGVRDTHWGDYSGAKTKYKLSPKDIVFSYIRTFLLTPGERHKYGGTKELDQKWYAKAKARRFLETGYWPNKYLLDAFFVDQEAFLRLDEEFDHKPLETLEVEGVQTPVFSVYLKEGAPVGTLLDFFKKNIVESLLFLHAPAEFLEEQHKTRTNSEEGSGLVHRVGYYWYGQREEDMLFAAPYMPFEHSLEGGHEVKKLKKNPNYWDQKWLKNPNNIKEIIDTSQEQDTTSFSQSNYSNFAQGITGIMSFSNLSAEQSKKIKEGSDSNVPKDLIKISTDINKGSIPWFASFNVSPKPNVDKNGNVDTSLYAFNDAYSKFMYGASLEELAKGEVQTLKSFFGEDQISFRSLLLAGVNWHRAILDYTEGDGLYSLTLAAPDARLDGSDQDTTKYKTTAQAYSLSNTPFVVFEGKKDLWVPIEENVKGAASHKRSESYMGGGPQIYAQLQDKMTALLDKVFAKLNLDSSSKFEVSLHWTSYETKDVWNQSWEAILETLNNLDKKGRLQFAKKQLTDRADYDAKNEYFARSFIGWGYDFEGNGSYLDAVFSRDFIAPYLYTLLDKEESDPNNPFPMLTRLAKLLDKSIQEGKRRFKAPLKDWFELTNKDTWHRTQWLEVEGFPDPSAEFTLFFLTNQKEFTNEEHIKLNVELAVLNGPFFNYKSFAANPNKAKTYLSHKGVRRPTFFVETRNVLETIDTTFDPLEEEKK